MKTLVIALVLLAAVVGIAMLVVKSRRTARIESARKLAQVQAQRRSEPVRLAAPTPSIAQRTRPVRYSGGVAKAATSPKRKATETYYASSQDTSYAAPDFGYADYSYDSGSSYTDSGNSGSSSGSSYDSGSSSSSYDSGSSSSSSDSGSSW